MSQKPNKNLVKPIQGHVWVISAQNHCKTCEKQKKIVIQFKSGQKPKSKTFYVQHESLNIAKTNFKTKRIPHPKSEVIWHQKDTWFNLIQSNIQAKTYSKDFQTNYLKTQA